MLGDVGIDALLESGTVDLDKWDALVPDIEIPAETREEPVADAIEEDVVTHREEGRQFVYRSTVSEAEVQRTMVASLTDRLFEGDVTALVSHLLTEQEIDVDELERLQELIDRARRQEG